jgi:hypothetical protein
VLILALGAGGAFYYLGRPAPGNDEPQPEVAAVPSAPPAAAIPGLPSAALPPPVAEPPPSVPAAPPPATAARTVDMVDIGDDLVPPVTDGLRPARKVQAIRIIVENDRELPQPR